MLQIPRGLKQIIKRYCTYLFLKGKNQSEQRATFIIFLKSIPCNLETLQKQVCNHIKCSNSRGCLTLWNQSEITSHCHHGTVWVLWKTRRVESEHLLARTGQVVLEPAKCTNRELLNSGHGSQMQVCKLTNTMLNGCPSVHPFSGTGLIDATKLQLFSLNSLAAMAFFERKGMWI